MLGVLRRALREQGRLRIAAPGLPRRAAILELLGALELTRGGEAELEQEQLWTPLYLLAREEGPRGDLARN